MTLKSSNGRNPQEILLLTSDCEKTKNNLVRIVCIELSLGKVSEHFHSCFNYQPTFGIHYLYKLILV